MTARSDRELIERMSRRALTYRDVGATARDEVPPGYQLLHRSTALGHGRPVLERAAEGLMSWQMHARAGIDVVPSTPVAAVGTVVVQLLGRRPLALSAPCRVVHVVTEPRSRGFAYGTLAGHPESGEELFLLRHEDDDQVTFTVHAFSRPATLLARAGGPLTRRVQAFVTGRYLAAMRDLAA